MKWILRYLRSIIGVCLEFRSKDGLIGYVNVDYAGDRDNRRSMTGYVFSVGKCAVSWKATLHNTVTLSTIEAEYMTAVEGIKEAIWLRGLFVELSPN